MSLQITENKETIFAYSTIQDFFEIYSLKNALSYLQSILKAANTKKIWKKSYPFNLLHYMQQLDKIANAAFYIHENFSQRDKVIIRKNIRIANPQLDQLKNCMGSLSITKLLVFFPRKYNASAILQSLSRFKKFL